MAAIPRKRARFLETASGLALVYLALLGAIALAGFNSGNNLLYLISGVMVAVVFISVLAGRANISRLLAKRRLPAYVFAGHPLRIIVEIINRKRFLKSFAVFVEAGVDYEKASFLPAIDSKGTRILDLQVQLDRRGLFRFPPMLVRSRFPLGLFEMKKRLKDNAEVIVYPRIYDLGEIVGGRGHIQNEFPQHLKGPGTGLYGVREYRHGEDAANISWKLSAKLDKLIIRETECEEMRRVCIVFDNSLGERSPASLEAFERAVSNAASLVWYLCRNEYSVKLITQKKVVRYAEGIEHMHEMLRLLALIEPTDAEEARVLTSRARLEGGTAVLVTTDTMNVRAVDRAGNRFTLVLGEKGGAAVS